MEHCPDLCCKEFITRCFIIFIIILKILCIIVTNLIIYIAPQVMQRKQKALSQLNSNGTSSSNNVERLVTQQLKGGLLRRGGGANEAAKKAEDGVGVKDASMPDFAKPRPISMLGLDKLAASKRASQLDDKKAAAKAKLFGSGRVLSSAAQELGDDDSESLPFVGFEFSSFITLVYFFLFFVFSIVDVHNVNLNKLLHCINTGTIAKEKKRKFREKVPLSCACV
jgi:hypothetical protein